MNIDDVKLEVEPTLENVFKEQHRLMMVYQEIEGSTYPVNLDTREGQHVVKDFLWRITEEIGEALDSNLGIAHVKEELSDALHFLIELSIFTEREPIIREIFSKFTWQKGIAAQGSLTNLNLAPLWIKLARVGRTCKNKPWKQTQIPIDQRQFSLDLESMVFEFLYTCKYLFSSHTELYTYYLKKGQVNEFRQRSGY